MSVPTGLSISGSPITSSGTLALRFNKWLFDSNYSKTNLIGILHLVEATTKQKVMLRQIHENQTRPHQKVMLHQVLDKLIRFGKQMESGVPG